MLLKHREHESVIKFNRMNSDRSILIFTDAAHANLLDGISNTSGLAVFIADKSGNMSPLSWRSNKIIWVVRSTLAADTLALQEGIKEALYVRHMKCEILGIHAKIIPIHSYIDSRSLLEALRST